MCGTPVSITTEKKNVVCQSTVYNKQLLLTFLGELKPLYLPSLYWSRSLGSADIISLGFGLWVFPLACMKQCNSTYAQDLVILEHRDHGSDVSWASHVYMSQKTVSRQVVAFYFRSDIACFFYDYSPPVQSIEKCLQFCF